MDYIGIDLHKNSSQVCILTEDGELVERRIKTDKESFDKLFADRPPTRILVEASTESEWCVRHLEALGHEVIIADPNFAPMYATRDRRIKTDKRDARALCEACRLGAYPRPTAPPTRTSLLVGAGLPGRRSGSSCMSKTRAGGVTLSYPRRKNRSHFRPIGKSGGLW
jgi:transposase